MRRSYRYRMHQRARKGWNDDLWARGHVDK